MAAQLSHKDRIERVLNGGEIDRPPISAWRHFYDRENSRDGLVEAMIEFQRKFDWDFMKINPRAFYHIQDWGANFEPSKDPLLKSSKISLPVTKAADWAKIVPLDPAAGVLGETLSAVHEIIRQIGSEIHIVHTVFSPLSIAGDLVDGGDSHFVELLRESPDDLHLALESITTTFVEFVRESMKTGISGIFFATTEWASRDLLTEEEYLEFGQPYDLRVLKTAGGARLNIIHVCGKNNMLPLFREYPAPVLSWNPFEEGNLSIHQAAQICGKLFLTGMDQNITLLSGPPAVIIKQIEDSLRDVPLGRLMVGPGCALKVTTPDDNLRAAAEAVKGWNKSE
jgi:uroporphyrinogen decarboxylase